MYLVDYQTHTTVSARGGWPGQEF